MSKSAVTVAVEAIMDLAKDVAEGRVSPADLDREAAAKTLELYRIVDGPADPIWPIQVEIARQVMARGGIPLEEMQQWVAVAMSRANVSAGENVQVDSRDSGGETEGPANPTPVVCAHCDRPTAIANGLLVHAGEGTAVADCRGIPEL